MKRLLFLALAFPAIAFGAWVECWVTGETNLLGDTNIGNAAGDAITVGGSMTIQEVVLFDVGAVGAPGMSWDGDPDSGRYWVGADSFADAVAGGQIVLYDATGATFTGINGPIGTVTPAQGEFTNIYGGGLHYFGVDATDVHQGHKERSEYITFQDCFTVGVDATYAVDWNLAGVVGAGTNTVTVRDGWSELVTGGAGVDMESTVSVGLIDTAAYAPRFETVVDLTNLVTQRFEIGWYIAANELVEIVYDVAIGVNWMLQIDDTTGMETIDSGVAATVNPVKLSVSIDAAGDVTEWAIDDVVMTQVGIANVMTANPYYFRWMLTDTAAAAHTAAVDYVQIERLKQQ